MPINIRDLQTLTPEQVADILQVKKNTVYQLINRAAIISKKIGGNYRIPLTSLSFAVTGLDYDLYQAEQADLVNMPRVRQALRTVRGQ